MSYPDQQPSHTSGFYTPVGTRRRFFQWVTRAAAGFIGLALAVPIIGYVISPICTHLGCGYHWDAADRKFKCPCHGSVYDVTGQVLAGPAPRHLDDLPSKVENGRLLVMYKEFKSGVRERVEL